MPAWVASSWVTLIQPEVSSRVSMVALMALERGRIPMESSLFRLVDSPAKDCLAPARSAGTKTSAVLLAMMLAIE
ncbi:hypothetical protein A6R72_09490 [Xanthomonas translucens pv. graminis]|nr:hypothetical protein A6R72_09490 [Xanthomonas translucens pv. graminis]